MELGWFHHWTSREICVVGIFAFFQSRHGRLGIGSYLSGENGLQACRCAGLSQIIMRMKRSHSDLIAVIAWRRVLLFNPCSSHKKHSW